MVDLEKYRELKEAMVDDIQDKMYEVCCKLGGARDGTRIGGMKFKYFYSGEKKGQLAIHSAFVVSEDWEPTEALYEICCKMVSDYAFERVDMFEKETEHFVHFIDMEYSFPDGEAITKTMIQGFCSEDVIPDLKGA